MYKNPYEIWLCDLISVSLILTHSCLQSFQYVAPDLHIPVRIDIGLDDKEDGRAYIEALNQGIRKDRGERVVSDFDINQRVKKDAGN